MCWVWVCERPVDQTKEITTTITVENISNLYNVELAVLPNTW